ncbi:MAG TPA: MATE family efflux transporter [Pyrinomonadaceae bacterium]|nr:MATE family efflux transporter [Pyrinomonadaceae bacterium]
MLQSSENSVSVAENNSFWSILREAVAGSSRDFTTGSIWIAIFLLAIPMILEMGMESIFAIVDIYFVGHLGADSVAVVGLTESMLAIIYAVAIGLSIGATATVARRIGEKDAEGAARSAAHALYLGVLVSLLMSAVGIIFAPTFLSLLGAEPQVIELGTTFTRIMLGGNAVIVFLFLLNAIFRGAGDAAIAMRVLILANVLNIFLSPCFVMGPGIFAFLGINAPSWLVDNWIFPQLGVTGAAIGTTIGRGAGVLFAAWWLFRAGGRITIHKEHWKLNSKILSGLIKVAAPAVLQFTIATASWSALVRVMAGFGSEAIAGYVIGLRVIMFALLPAIGLSNAAATLVGQNLGAGKPERAETSVWKAAFLNAVVLGLTGLIFLFFSNRIVSIFTNEPDVLAYGTNCLHIVAYGFVFYAFGMVLETAFNGAGDTWTPTYLNFFIFWLFEIPLAYTLAYKFGFGADGVFWAITIAFSLLAIVSALLFKRGKWKEKKV